MVTKKDYFRKMIQNGAYISGSLLIFVQGMLPPLLHNLLLAIAGIFIVLFIVFSAIPSIFKNLETDSYILPKNGILLFLSHNINIVIDRVFMLLLFVLLIIDSNQIHIPTIVAYMYWMIFGAFFYSKITRYLTRYLKKYETVRPIDRNNRRKNK